jgi:hypothetical protein
MAGKSFLDQAKEIGVKAKDAVAKNSDKIEDAVDKAAGYVDDKTKGKYAQKISKVRSAAHDAIGKLEEPPSAKGDTDPDVARPDPGALASPVDDSATGTDPPVVVPDPGLGDGPAPGPNSVDEGPPVATPDPGLAATAGAASGDAVPYPPESPAPPPAPDWPGPTDADYGAPAGIPDDPAWPGSVAGDDAAGDEPVASPDPGAPEPG